MSDPAEYTSRYIGLSAVFGYYAEGAKLAFSPGVRRFIFVPILANVVLIVLAVALFFFVVSGWLSNLLMGLDWPVFGALAYMLSCIMSSFVVFVMVYCFSTLSVIIAAPFYGFLAQKIEYIKSGAELPDEAFSALMRDVPRIIGREIDKQCFFIPWALLCLVFAVLPGLNLLAPLMWVTLTSYMGTIQFADYGFDNHKISFKSMRQALGENKICTLTFGFIVVLGLSIPLINLVLPVIAVCAATLYFMDMYQGHPPMPGGVDSRGAAEFRDQIAASRAEQQNMPAPSGRGGPPRPQP